MDHLADFHGSQDPRERGQIAIHRGSAACAGGPGHTLGAPEAKASVAEFEFAGSPR
jgi:hypothetical protein